MEPESSLLYSQVPAICPYPEQKLVHDDSFRNIPPLEIRVGEYFTSGLFCLQRKHLAYEYFLTFCFSWGGVVSASPNPQAGGSPLVGRLRSGILNFPWMSGDHKLYLQGS